MKTILWVGPDSAGHSQRYRAVSSALSEFDFPRYKWGSPLKVRPDLIVVDCDLQRFLGSAQLQSLAVPIVYLTRYLPDSYFRCVQKIIDATGYGYPNRMFAIEYWNGMFNWGLGYVGNVLANDPLTRPKRSELPAKWAHLRTFAAVVHKPQSAGELERLIEVAKATGADHVHVFNGFDLDVSRRANAYGWIVSGCGYNCFHEFAGGGDFEWICVPMDRAYDEQVYRSANIEPNRVNGLPTIAAAIRDLVG